MIPYVIGPCAGAEMVTNFGGSFFESLNAEGPAKAYGLGKKMRDRTQMADDCYKKCGAEQPNTW